MTKIGFIIGSTRPDRKAEVVARWTYDTARKPMFSQYSHDLTQAWLAVFLHLSKTKHSMLTE